MISDRNYAGKTTPSAIDEEYVSCNFCQSAPGTQNGQKVPVRLFPGDDTPRTFRRCNLTNCLPPPGSTLDRCTTFLCDQHVVIRTEQIIIDGETLEIPIYGSVVYGYVHPQTLAVVYYPEPVVLGADQ